jgi:hypothetical protein
VTEPAWVLVLAAVLDSATALAVDSATALDSAKVTAQGLATPLVVQGSARVQVLRLAAAPRPG